MKRVAHGIEALGLVLFAGSLVFAQAPGNGSDQQGPPMTNLQIFPKDMPRAQLLQTMNAFDTSLGVQCSYCHVLEGPGGRNDFASDEKQTKRTARQMILLRDSINVILPTVVSKSPGVPVRVLCLTCHRGLPIPKQIADVVSDAEGGGGARAGLVKFKDLRAQFYGSWTYDFSENALLSIAQRAVTAARFDDATVYLQANLEYFPKSARTYQAMAQVKIAQNNKGGAISDLEKAVELDPNNAQAKTQLQQLKGP